MRLLNVYTYCFHEFFDDRVPKYAILSHTWNDEEVLYGDMKASDWRDKPGWQKIVGTCTLAMAMKIRFVWIDCCCIDRTNSAELSENINAMFKYYRNSEVCFVYLEDLGGQIDLAASMSSGRWWTRGWTLQELIAPRRVWFFNQEWKFIVDKFDYASQISDRTRIPSDALLGRIPLKDYSIASKMSWAAFRHTSRAEDRAYSLLGIFDVNMALIYGEGSRAFRRLQHELMKQSNDLTIFAHSSARHLFAEDVDAFADMQNVSAFSDDFVEFTVTNRGLRIVGDIPLRYGTVTSPDQECEGVETYIMYLGFNATGSEKLGGGISLKKVGPNIYSKYSSIPLAGFGFSAVHQDDFFHPESFYILFDLDDKAQRLHEAYRFAAITVQDHPRISINHAQPRTLWDRPSNTFLNERPYRFARFEYPEKFARALLTSVDDEEDVLVLCVNAGRNPIAKVSRAQDHADLTSRFESSENLFEDSHQAALLKHEVEVLKPGRVSESVIGLTTSQGPFMLGVHITMDSTASKQSVFSMSFSFTEIHNSAS